MKLRLGASINYGTLGIRKRLELAEKYLVLQNWMNVLDLGCGNGAYTIEMASKANMVIGVDIEINRLNQFQSELMAREESYNAKIIQSDGQRLCFKDNTFDIVTLIEVIEHVPSEEKLLAEIYRVLKPDGKLVIFAPNNHYPFETHGARIWNIKLSSRLPFLSWLPAPIHNLISHARIYTSNGLRKILRHHGFTVLEVDYMMPPIDNLKNRNLKKFLRALTLALENTFLKRFGVSIMMIASKHG